MDSDVLTMNKIADVIANSRAPGTNFRSNKYNTHALPKHNARVAPKNPSTRSGARMETIQVVKPHIGRPRTLSTCWFHAVGKPLLK